MRPRRALITRAAAILATLGALLFGGIASAPATSAVLTDAPTFVPGDVAAQVTTENNYSAFPAATTLADGSTLVAYRSGSGHASADGRVRLRRSVDGDAWTDWREVPVPSTGRAYGPSGMDAETAAQGGRVYLGVASYVSTGPSSGTDFRPYLATSDDGGATWSTPTLLPQPVPGWSYLAGVLVTSTGDVIVGEYVRALDAPNRWSAHYFRSTNRGATWASMGVLSGTRDFGEPQMVELADGRILTALRSDAAGGYYDYIHTAIYDGTTWSTPKVAVIHATGSPNLARLPSGHVVLSYRGYNGQDEALADSRPARLAFFQPDGSGVYRANVDVLAGDARLSLYGQVVGSRFVVALESPPDLTAPTASLTATVYSVPIRFAPIPAW